MNGKEGSINWINAVFLDLSLKGIEGDEVRSLLLSMSPSAMRCIVHLGARYF